MNDPLQVLSFRARKEIFCLKLEDIAEVVEHADVVPLPRLPRLYDGIFQLRGRVITLYNLGLQLREPATNSQIVILAEPRDHFALRIPGIIETEVIHPEKSETIESEDLSAEILESILYGNQEIYHLLSAEKIFAYASKLVTDQNQSSSGPAAQNQGGES